MAKEKKDQFEQWFGKLKFPASKDEIIKFLHESKDVPNDIFSDMNIIVDRSYLDMKDLKNEVMNKIQMFGDKLKNALS